MTIRFILGRAGSGKTHHCLQSAATLSKESPLGPPLILLVPEQATFQMERELARLCGGGTFRAQVLSFGRLAYRVLQEGKSLPPPLSELGRQMILRRVLQNHHQELSVLAKAARQPRFCLQLSAQIRELNNYLVTAQMLQEFAGHDQCAAALRGKLQDLATVAAAYRQITAGQFTDPENILELLAEALTAGALPHGTRVWIDGFAGFTKQELSVLAALFSAAEHLEIALCLDPQEAAFEPAEDSLFHPTHDTYRRLRCLAGETGVQALPPLMLTTGGPLPRFLHCAALAHLEAQFACLPAEPFAEATDAVRLVTAAGPRAEVEAVACDIRRLVRENNWRYRDIAVILRDFARYHDLVAAIFKEYDIPCFIDERRSAAHHPLVEFMRSALEAALSNLQAASMSRLLKTDLLPLTREEADRLENFVRAHGIRGKRWLDDQPWNYRLRLSLEEERDEQRLGEAEGINNARLAVARSLAPFYHELTGPGLKTASAYCRSLWNLLESVGAMERLQMWEAQLIQQGETGRAAEHRQVWQGVADLISQADEVLGKEQMSLQEFTQIINAGLEGLTLGLVPAGVDQVVVGSVERSRQPQLQAAYVLGLSEGDFPARLQEEGLFGDEERGLLAGGGVELADTRRQKLFHEQYLSYIALSRSSRYLWASCPLADEEGKAKRPSVLFKRLAAIFVHNKIYFAANIAGDEDWAELAGVPQKTAAALLLRAGRSLSGIPMPPYWQTVYNAALRDRETRAAMAALWGALTETNVMPPLKEDTVRALFGTPLKSSVSRLEQFARCPFAHFARYGLRLEERAEHRLEAPDLGNFYHAALRLFVDRLRQDGLSWKDIDQQCARLRMDEVVEELIPRLRDEILMSSARMRYLAAQIKEILGQAIASLTEHAHSSLFLPVAAELSFGKGELAPWRLPAGETELWLYGQIDRVDMALDGNRAYMRVIDYKTNPMDFKLGDAWYGLALQLPAYAAVVLENAPAFSEFPAYFAGAFYFGIQQPLERVKNPDAGQKETTARMDGLAPADADVVEMLGGPGLVRRVAVKKDGTFSKLSRVADEVQLSALFSWLRSKMAALAAEILDGKAEAYPYRKQSGQRACTFCSYLPLCRFDLKLGNSYRLLLPLSHEEALAAISQPGGGDGCGQLDN